MKYFIIILFPFPFVSKATNYYVSNSGNNSNAGTSTGAPYLTVAKALSVTGSGDTIFLAKGSTFAEGNLTVNNSSLVISSYGSGTMPIVTGLVSVGSWVTTGGMDAIRAHKSHHLTVSGDSILDVLNDAVMAGNVPTANVMTDTCKNATISNNYIKRIAIYSGMAANYNKAAMSLVVYGDSLTIYHNEIDSVGYIPSYCEGPGSIISYNYVKNFCLTKQDGAGLYAYIGDGTVFISTYCAFYCYQCYNDTVTNNVFDDSSSYTIYANGTTGQVHGLYFTKNTVNQRNTSYPAQYSDANITQFIDSNVFVRSAKPDSMLAINTSYYSYGSFVKTTGYNGHGSGNPCNIRTQPYIFYNPTLADSTVVLPKALIDNNGIFQINSIVLRPFAGVVLWDTYLTTSSPITNLITR